MTSLTRPKIAMVVNNAMAHDARVLKSAQALAEANAEVHVLGVGPQRESGSLASAALERLVVLPDRRLSVAYGRWALARRLGRMGPAANWHRSLAITAYYERAFVPALREIEPDAIHIHDVHLISAVARYADEARVRPYLFYDAHEYVAGLAVSGGRTQRAVDGWAALEREYIQKMDRVITVSDGLSSKIRDTHGLTRDPAVVHNAPLISAGAPSANLRLACGIGLETPLAVYSGAVSAARGLETVIAVLPYHPELHIAIVAVPHPHPMTAEFRLQAQHLGVMDRLHFPPPVSSYEVSGYLSGANFAVSPIIGTSISYDMALPNKLFEYLHAGLPMVVSNCQAISQFVTENQLGTVFKAGSVEDLTRAIGEVFNYSVNEDTHELKQRYSWQGQVPHLLEVYREKFPELIPYDVWQADFCGQPSWQADT